MTTTSRYNKRASVEVGRPDEERAAARQSGTAAAGASEVEGRLSFNHRANWGYPCRTGECRLLVGRSSRKSQHGRTHAHRASGFAHDAGRNVEAETLAVSQQQKRSSRATLGRPRQPGFAARCQCRTI